MIVFGVSPTEAQELPMTENDFTRLAAQVAMNNMVTMTLLRTAVEQNHELIVPLLAQIPSHIRSAVEGRQGQVGQSLFDQSLQESFQNVLKAVGQDTAALIMEEAD